MATTTVAPEVLDKLFSRADERYELVDGVLQAKPMVTIYHGLMISWLSKLLNDQVGDDLYVLTDPLSKIREDHWRLPDVAVIRAEDAEPWKYVMPGHWPMLCIELVSPPSQTVEQLLEKCKLYHEQGVAHCWVIQPESRVAWTFHRQEQPICVSTQGGELDASSIGVSIYLTDLWRGLKNKRSNRIR